MKPRESKRSRTRATLIAGVSLALALGGMTAIGASASTGRSVLRGSRPQWATASARVGRASANGAMDVRVYLAPRGGIDGLKAAVAAISTPGSAQYRHFITPAQYRARYEPTGVEVNAVKAWLANAGMKIIKVEGSRRYVEAAGTVGSASSAFGVTFDTFRKAGKVYSAPSTDASVPSSLGATVLGVTGLDSLPRIAKPAFPPPNGFRNGRPCSAYFGQIKATYQADYSTPLPQFNGTTYAYAPCGYTPTQFRSAYGAADSGLSGAGVTVTITDAYASPTILGDANHYGNAHGDGPFAEGQFTQTTNGAAHGNLCGASGWFSEESLDVEAVHGMAPDADVHYYGAKSCFNSDLRDAMAEVVDDNDASIVTNSWGTNSGSETSGDIAADEQVFLQGATQGIGFMFSSGDNGDWLPLTGTVQTDYPATDPYVTSVGGTTTMIDRDGGLANETGWGTIKYSLSSDGNSWDLVGYLYGSGGGFSALFNRPSYQDGVVPPSSLAGRASPDIAFDADPTTGMLIGLTQRFPEGDHYGEYRIGGTSLASPLFAGFQALAEQNAGERLGFANPTIYSLAQSDPGAFRDVLTIKQGANVRADYANGVDPSDGILYSVRTFDQDSTLRTGPGWDDVTGIGSPTGEYLDSFGGGTR